MNTKKIKDAILGIAALVLFSLFVIIILWLALKASMLGFYLNMGHE